MKYLMALFIFILSHTLSHAAVTINIVEDGSNVVATASGTVNLAGLAPPSGTLFSNSLLFGDVTQSVLILGSVSFPRLYSIDTVFLDFAMGGLFQPLSNTGNAIGLFSSNSANGMYLPQGYVSGTQIDSSSTWAGETFSSIGLIIGTYEFTWGSGATADSLTLNIIAPSPSVPASPIPTLPAWVLAILIVLMGLIGFKMRRRYFI